MKMLNFLSMLLIIHVCTSYVHAHNDAEKPLPWFPKLSEGLGATPVVGRVLKDGYESSVVQDGVFPAAAISMGMNILCCCTPLAPVALPISLGTGIVGGYLKYNLASVFSTVKTIQRSLMGIKGQLDVLTRDQHATLEKVENTQAAVNVVSQVQQQQGTQITRIDATVTRVDAAAVRIASQQQELMEQQKKDAAMNAAHFKKMQHSLRLANQRLKKMERELQKAREEMGTAIHKQGKQIQDISDNVRHITNSLVIESNSNKPLALPYHVPVSQINAPSYVVSALTAAHKKNSLIS